MRRIKCLTADYEEIPNPHTETVKIDNLRALSISPKLAKHYKIEEGPLKQETNAFAEIKASYYDVGEGCRMPIPSYILKKKIKFKITDDKQLMVLIERDKNVYNPIKVVSLTIMGSKIDIEKAKKKLML